MPEGIIVIPLAMVFNTFSNAWRVFTPHITLRAVITHLSQTASQHVALEVITFVDSVCITSLLRTNELVPARILTFLHLLIEHEVLEALESLLKPSMFKGNARVVFTTVIGINKLSWNRAWWQATSVAALSYAFIKFHSIWALVAFWC